MKKITSGMLALVMLLVSLINIMPIKPVYARTEDRIEWTEDDFIYSSSKHIIAFSEKGIEKQKKTKVLKFPEGTKSVRGNYSLTNPGKHNHEFGRGKEYDLVVFPNSVEDIGYACFYSAKIKEVKLSENLKTIGGLAFFDCGLERIELPEGLLYIEHNAFERNNIEEVTIPKSVKRIEQYVFSRNKLHTINILGKPDISGKGVFYKQVVDYYPKQNPFYESQFGYKGNIGLKEIPKGLHYENQEFNFDKDINKVSTEFKIDEIPYSGTITIHNSHKYSGGTQTDTSSEDIENLEKEIKDLENQIEELKKDKEANQDKIRKLEEKLENCKDKGNKLIEEKKKLENQVAKKDKTIKELEVKIQDLENGDIEQIAELEQVRDEVKRLQVENEKLKEDLSTAKWELEAEKEKTEASEEKIQELTEKITQLEKIRKEKDDEILSKNETIKELEDKLNAKEDEIKALQEQLEKVKADKEKCCEKMEGLKKEIEEIKTKTEEDKKKLEEKIKALEKEVKEQVERFNKLEKELEEKIEEANKKIEELEKKLEDNKATENETEDNKKEELEKILEDIKKRQDELEKAQKKEEERKGYKLEVDEVKDRDKEITGKTQSNWYLDVYRGNKRLGGSQADSRGYFTIRLRDEVKTGDKILLIAEDPKDKKESIEKEISVQGNKKEESKETNKDVVKDKDITSEGKDKVKGYKTNREFSVFQVNKDFYNIIKEGKKTTVYMDVKAYIQDDRIMLPVRYAAYTLGFNVEYDDSKREAIFSNKENTALPKKTLRLNIDTGVMKDSQGNIYHSDTKPVIINGRIHASISNIAKAFNATCGDIRDGKDQSIEWDNSRKAVYVFKNIK